MSSGVCDAIVSRVAAINARIESSIAYKRPTENASATQSRAIGSGQWEQYFYEMPNTIPVIA